MSSLRFLILAAAMTLLPPLVRADVNVTNDIPCTTMKVVVKQYFFNDGMLGSCPTWEASAAYGASLVITNVYQSWWDSSGYHTFEIRYEVQYTYHVSAPCLSVSGSGTIKAGVTDPSATVTLSMGGSAAMGDITLGSSDTGRFTLTELSRDAGNRTITVRITGVAATPTSAPGGDAKIKGLIQGTVAADGPNVLVVVPTTSSHSPGTSYWTNTYSGGILGSGAYQVVTITINDQFGNALPGIFAGTGKVDERFDSQTGSNAIQFTATRLPISLPNGALYSSGSIDDQCGQEANLTFAVTLTSGQQAQWTAGTLNVVLPNGTSGHNVLQASYQGTTHQHSGTMILWVWGTQLTSTPVRAATLTTNHPAVFSVTN